MKFDITIDELRNNDQAHARLTTALLPLFVHLLLYLQKLRHEVREVVDHAFSAESYFRHGKYMLTVDPAMILQTGRLWFGEIDLDTAATIS